MLDGKPALVSVGFADPEAFREFADFTAFGGVALGESELGNPGREPMPS